MKSTLVLLLAFAALAKGQLPVCLKNQVINLDLITGALTCRDNGKMSELAQVQQTGGLIRECPFDVTFVIDESGSINDEGFANIKLFMKAVMRTFSDLGASGTHFGVISFSGLDAGPTNRFQLGSFDNQADYDAAVDAIPRTPGSAAGDITGTCISCGILRASERQADHDASFGPDHAVLRKKVFMVLTDGRTTPIDKFARPKAAADAARAAGVTLFAIGVGNQVSDQEISNIANDPDSDYKWVVNDFDQLLTLGGLLGVGLECGTPDVPPDGPIE